MWCSSPHPRRVGLAALVFALLLLPAASAGGAERLDKKAISRLADRFFAARPWTRFVAWDPAVRKALLAEAAALDPLPEGSLETVRDLLWKAARKHAPRLRKNEIETPYEQEATWLQNGTGGPKAGLLIGLHGGGPGAGSAGEATKWSLPRHLGMYPQGIRLVHDTWNSVHGEAFVLTLIELAKVRYQIDPDRVYVAGFSMGGSGSWHLAGRHPDLFAGAIPAHGVLMAEPTSNPPRREDVLRLQHGFVRNVRNLAVYFYTGFEDRNCRPWTFLMAWDEIEALKAADPGGYLDVRFAAYEGLAHAFPPGEPQTGLEWIREKRRNAFPEKLVWEYIAYPEPRPDEGDHPQRLQKYWFYWLHCLRPEEGDPVVATRTGNVFDLEVGRAFPEDFTIYLNSSMIDVEEEVVVRVAGTEVWRGRPKPELAAIFESLDARLDRTMTFDRRVRIPEPP